MAQRQFEAEDIDRPALVHDIDDGMLYLLEPEENDKTEVDAWIAINEDAAVSIEDTA
jgi:hypothetical protein